MAAATTGAQFVLSCLALGLGLFLIAGAARDFFRGRLVPALAARGLAVLGGALLVAAGVYAAGVAVPL